MIARRAVAALVLGALAIGGLGACSKTEGERRPTPMSQAERDRGRQACQAYLDRLCACAKAKGTKELQDRCELKRAKPEALELALEVNDDPSVTGPDVLRAQEEARKIIAKCIEENLALDTECP